MLVIFIVLPQNFNKVSPPFSRGRTHDLFDRWNHVILCVGFYTSDYFLPSLFLLVARRSCVASAASPRRVVLGAICSQQLVSEQGQIENVCDQVRYLEVRWRHQF